MSRPSSPKSLGLYRTQKRSTVTSVFQTLGLVASSYLTGVFTYLVLIQVSDIPRGPLWDESFRAPLAFVLIVVVASGFILAYFQKEWDRGTRSFSILSALFLLAFTSLSTKSVVDPVLPLRLTSHYLMEPLRHFLQF
ncbi:MAG: hypothetical protein NVS2B3_05620 [Vulcanimicrobiaceae bacterium]